jgi:ubiquinone/menaquinone biosynthesis C-methylase UbiE/phosphohistidine phosphatase SixA
MKRMRIPRLAWLLWALTLGLTARVDGAQNPDLAAELRQGGFVIYFRHADTGPATPDPPGVDLARCDTQRNLNEKGRAEAAEIGRQFTRLGIPVGAVRSSRFCRCWQTAQLAFGRYQLDPLLTGVPRGPEHEPARRAASDALRNALSTIPPKGENTVLVAHGFNLIDLEGLYLSTQGEAAIYRPDGNGGYHLVAQVLPQEWASFPTPQPGAAHGAHGHEAAHEHHPMTEQDVHRLHSDRAAYIAMLEDPQRDAWQRPAQVVSALRLREGDSVADVGAGSGYFTLRLAGAVGAGGRVHAVDISRDMLSHLEQRVRAAGVPNVDLILAKPDDPLLAPGSVDLVFICDTWHHIDDRVRYLATLTRALKPGARVAIVDFYPRELPVGPPPSMKLSRDQVVGEFAAAGFHVAEEHDFLDYQYFLVFARD